jgi:hypothetical protein
MEIEIQNTITLAVLVAVAFSMGGMWRDVRTLKEDVKSIKRKIFNGYDQRKVT